jgi:hypothetical protein
MDSLEFPDLEWKEGKAQPAIEVSIDFLPQRFRGKWHRAVHEVTAEWMGKHPFKKRATIWMWGCISVNMISRHPEHAQPSWSDFLIQFGLPNTFIPYLEHRLASLFKDQAAITEVLHPVREDGWTAICHVEQGRVWKESDADVWEPFFP